VFEAATEFEALARALREAGEKGLAQELRKGINEAARPLPDEIRASLIPHLPDNYAKTLDADLDIKIQQRTAGTNAGVSVVAKARGTNTASPGTGVRPGQPPSRQGKGRKLNRLNAGLLTHPVYGNREVWRTQGPEGGGMRPGWFTDPVRAAAPRVRREIEAAVRRVRDKIYQTP
jgi:hypothetical protein